jgi:hypothetical protein
MDWFGVLWFSGVLFMMWIAAIGLLSSGIAGWQRRVAPVPETPDPRDSYTSLSIVLLIIATLAALASLGLLGFASQTTTAVTCLFWVEILSVSALVASIALAIKGRGTAS